MGVAQCAVDARSEHGFDEVGIIRSEAPVHPQPTLEGARRVQVAHLLDRLGRIGFRLQTGQIRRLLEPVANNRTESFRIECTGLLHEDLLMLGGEVGVAVRGIVDGPEMVTPEPPGSSFSGNAGQQGHRLPLPPPAPHVGPGSFRGPHCRRQRTVRRPTALLLKSIQEHRRQGMRSVQELFGSNYRDAQLIVWDLHHVERTNSAYHLDEIDSDDARNARIHTVRHVHNASRLSPMKPIEKGLNFGNISI